ncbi:ABC transporter substrate-binding protein [Xinfangfangia sp. CPCC 101601]|uniref:ABC transporter substrate-binding protein n=1 Tax=Pseudogemmobacter lacusdianii TaxID=3069608 RepID=A0ABU0VW22_9RHOB|nr:ABC transporter substrate-binding protein [Xinfangfangia sp. CPCC 101601]MDQ2065898.1 ABC transporter substrate-binding protein [Xinfangfangia sp. CPCC 101601]
MLTARWLHKFALLSAANLGSAAYAEGAITLAGWGGTWNEAYKTGITDPFTEKTGISVVLDEWDGSLARVRAMVEAGAVSYDLVSIEAPQLEMGCDEGLFLPLPASVTAQAPHYLPGTLHDCGIASDTWATVLVYDGTKLTNGPKSWADFWDVKAFPGKRGLGGQALYTLENALLADGVAPSDIYTVLATPEGVDRAFAKLDEIKPHVVWWSSSSTALQNLDAGEVVMTDMYNGRVTFDNENNGKDYRIVWEAGFLYGTDLWALVADAPNPEGAAAFLEFFAVPENQAGFPRLYGYGTGDARVYDHLTEAQRSRLPTSPDVIGYGASYNDAFWAENLESLEQRFKVWQSQ